MFLVIKRISPVLRSARSLACDNKNDIAKPTTIISHQQAKYIQVETHYGTGDTMEAIVTENTVKESLSNRYELINGQGQDAFQKAYDFNSSTLLKQMNCYPYYQTIDQNEGPEAIINGKTCTMLGSNNYLGLTIDERVRNASIEAIKQYGTSLTGSRLLNGTHRLHE